MRPLLMGQTLQVDSLHARAPVAVPPRASSIDAAVASSSSQYPLITL